MARPHPADLIRLMVVEPRTLLGVGVREILEREDDIEVVAQTQSAAEAIPIVGEAAPDVILVNLPSELPAAAFRPPAPAQTPNAALIVMGGDDDDASIVRHSRSGPRPRPELAGRRARRDDPGRCRRRQSTPHRVAARLV
jgi:DNA-binding NarL/FixJ family response regulator